MVRDGRAVANSWLQMPWWDGYRGPDQWRFGPLPEEYRAEWEASGRSHVVLAGIAWKMLLDAFDAARALVPPDAWLELRYEDVLASPTASVESILACCDMEMHPLLASYLASHPPTTHRVASFAQDLDAASLRLLETSLSGHLAARGYGAVPSGSDS